MTSAMTRNQVVKASSFSAGDLPVPDHVRVSAGCIFESAGAMGRASGFIEFITGLSVLTHFEGFQKEVLGFPRPAFSSSP